MEDVKSLKVVNTEADDSDFMSLAEMLDVDDVTFDVVEVPEWAKGGKGGKVRIGSLTADDMMEWLEANEGPAKKTAALRLVAKSLVDKTGKRIGTAASVVHLASRNTQAIDRIVKKVLDLNGLKKGAAVEAKNASTEPTPGASPTN